MGDRAWRIRGGRARRDGGGGVWALGFVALSWRGRSSGRAAEDLDRAEVRAALEPIFGRQVAATAAGLFRFAQEVDRGDLAITPTVDTRELLMGRVTGDYCYEPGRLSDGRVWGHRRDVEWFDRRGIDVLP
jgi:hypothetical protein